MLEPLSSSAIPQADRVERVLEYAILLHHRQLALRDLLFRGRDAMYYRSAARVLDLIDAAGQPSERLLEYAEHGEDPLELLRDCFERSAVGQAWARWAKHKLWSVDPNSAEAFLDACAELSSATAQRRAKTLRTWLEELAPEDTGPSIEELRGALLARRLSSFHFSTRTKNVFHRCGFEFLHEPLRLGSERLLELRGFGLTTARELDTLLLQEPPSETIDELHAALLSGSHVWPEGFDPATPAPASADDPGELGWDELANSLPAHILELPIEQLDPPTRMQTYCTREAVQHVRELVATPKAELREARGVGRGTLVRTLEAILEQWRRFPTPELLAAGTSADPEFTFDPHAFTTVLELWEARLAHLDERDAQTIVRRCGALRASETLEEIGIAHGVTRERIRQLEKRGLTRLSSDETWMVPIRARLDALRGGASYLWLDDLERDPFMRPLVDRPSFVSYLFNRAIPDDVHAYPWDTALLLTHKRAREPEALYAELIRAVRKQAWPAPYATFLGFVNAALREDEADLRPLLIERAEASLVLDDPQHPSEVLHFGQARAGRILTHMATLDGPVSVQELMQLFGRGALPSACVMVRRGHVALPRHFPDFERWEGRLAPLIKRIIEREGPEQQWMAHDLLELAGEESRLPEWMTPWLLTSMLRRTGELEDLGRQRFALAGSSPQARVQLVPAAREILERAGAPLPDEELRARLSERVQLLGGTFNMLRSALPMFTTSEGHVGLVERDLPGGLDAVQVAGEHLETVLRSRGRGLTFHEALLQLRELSPEHQRWDRYAVGVVPRARPTLAANRVGIGLDAWDEVRVPSRADFMRELLDAGDGVAHVADFERQILERHGMSPTRATIGGVAHLIGARLRGDYLVIAELAEDFIAPAQPERTELPETQPAKVPRTAPAESAAAQVAEPPAASTPTPASTRPAQPAAAPAAPAPAPATEPEPEPEPERPLGPTPPPLPLGHPSATPLPPYFPGARDLRLPRAARQLYAKLAQERPDDWDAVLRRGAAHAARFEAALDQNEFLPLTEARELTARLPQLAARARASQDPCAERLAWVCARYFEIADDGELDFAIGGLDDDVALFNASARRLGFDDLAFEPT